MLYVSAYMTLHPSGNSAFHVTPIVYDTDGNEISQDAIDQKVQSSSNKGKEDSSKGGGGGGTGKSKKRGRQRYVVASISMNRSFEVMQINSYKALHCIALLSSNMSYVIR